MTSKVRHQQRPLKVTIEESFRLEHYDLAPLGTMMMWHVEAEGTHEEVTNELGKHINANRSGPYRIVRIQEQIYAVYDLQP